jgi:hypothetical protein
MHTLRIRWAVVFMSIWLTVGTAHAQAPSAAAQQEIEQLFTALQQSQCEFQRNGSWYDAGKATEHLRQKYDYLLKKKLAPTTEAFIERAATQSSLSGKPYQVRCGQAQAVPSKQWFEQQLKALRR